MNRNDILEEAAKVCDRIAAEHTAAAGAALERGEVMLGHTQITAARCAAAIRELKSQPSAAPADIADARRYRFLRQRTSGSLHHDDRWIDYHFQGKGVMPPSSSMTVLREWAARTLDRAIDEELASQPSASLGLKEAVQSPVAAARANMVLVPRKPSAEMLVAGANASIGYPEGAVGLAITVYHAMIAAATSKDV